MVEQNITYNPWPNGNVPEHLQRPELKQLKEAGYQFNDAREVVDIFEKKVAEFVGSKYAVSTDCCTHAMKLSLLYLLEIGEISKEDTLSIPKNTYISAAMLLFELGFENIKFDDVKWTGAYSINPTRVIDAAVQWRKHMYVGHNALQCLSFQIKKTIPIGRGGMILTDDKEAYEWLKLARYDGRDMSLPYDHPDHIKMNGYHYYLTPECCARGILLMDQIKSEGETASWQNYPDVTKMLKI